MLKLSVKHLFITIILRFGHVCLLYLYVLSQFCSMAFEKGCGGEKKIQPPEVFCKERCSKIFRNIHRKKPVPESLFK